MVLSVSDGFVLIKDNRDIYVPILGKKQLPP